MARNGAGTYTLPAGNPVVTGTTISSTTHNNTMNDIATAITGSIAADGQTPITANLQMNNFRHTGVGNATAQGQYASVSQVQNAAFNYLTGASGTDTITANSSISPAAYADGQKFTFVPAGTNTGAATLNVNGLGAIDILRQDGSATQAGDIVSGDPVTVEYISGDFYISNSNLESFGLKNKAILKDSSNITATAGGTADAITATFDPAISAVSDSLYVQINGLSPNTITNPTLDVGTGALTIVDENLTALEIGSMPVTGEFRFKTGSPNKAILMNPMKASLASTGNLYGFLSLNSDTTIGPEHYGKMLQITTVTTGPITLTFPAVTSNLTGKKVVIKNNSSYSVTCSSASNFVGNGGLTAPSFTLQADQNETTFVGGTTDWRVARPQITYSGTAPLYAARAWVNFNGTGTVAIRAAGNVSSITDDGTGLYTLNFTTGMPDSNYVVNGDCRRGSTDNNVDFALPNSGVYTVNQVQVRTQSSNNYSLLDADLINVTVVR